jgi:serine/threonine-protein kinase
VQPDRPHPDLDSFVERVRTELEPELQVVRPIGRSPVAVVLLAREPALKRLVAVKVLSPDLLGVTGAVRRFEREAQSAARIAHPNVVTVFRVGQLSDGLPYIAMQYVKGRSLSDVIQSEGRLTGQKAYAMLATVASAARAGHRRHVVHRDLKPSNVLLEANTGRIVVVDFGIAAILPSGEEPPEHITTAGNIVGDPQYMSPERLLGEAADEHSDVYNLALLAYEVLAGRGPFEAGSDMEWTRAHVRGEPAPISTLEPSVDDDLEDLLLRCLAKKPSHRPPAADFEAAMRSRAVTEASGLAHPNYVPAAAGATEISAPAPARVAAPSGLTGPTGQPFRLEVLGRLDLTRDEGGRVLSIVNQPKRSALLAYLALEGGDGVLRRDRVIEVFWPDLEAEQARHALRQSLYVLRGSLGSQAVVSQGDDEISVAPEVVWCDAVAFGAAIAADRPDVAMDLYSGPLLSGFYLEDVIEFEHWVDRQRLRLDRLATEAAWRLAAEREAAGDGRAALHWGRRAASLAPFDESVIRRLLELHARLGDRAGALNAFESFAGRLREELEAEPTEETLAVVERLRDE